MAIFPGEPELTRFIEANDNGSGFIEAKDDGSGADNWSYTVRSSSQIITTNQHSVFWILLELKDDGGGERWQLEL